jgi:hypothetical protein
MVRSQLNKQPNTPKDKTPQLQPVPPQGLKQLDEIGLKYFQGMGPLEYAVRLTGVPTTPAWRIRMRLYPENQGKRDGFRYRIKVDQYNLSPALYRDVVDSYGRENADRRLNNTTPHKHLEMVFRPVMNVSAELDPTSIKGTQSSVTQNPRNCGLGFGCAGLYSVPEDSQWTKDQEINLVRAPWEPKPHIIYGMVRGLAQQAGKLQLQGDEMVWIDGEIPEGVGKDRPWIEVLIDNYPGNGGGYQGYWIERWGADDSIRSLIKRMYANDETIDTTTAIVSTSYVCSRTNPVGKLRTTCP